MWAMRLVASEAATRDATTLGAAWVAVGVTTEWAATDAMDGATWATTRAAVWDATLATATWAAMWAAPWDATQAATWAAVMEGLGDG